MQKDKRNVMSSWLIIEGFMGAFIRTLLGVPLSLVLTIFACIYAL